MDVFGVVIVGCFLNSAALLESSDLYIATSRRKLREALSTGVVGSLGLDLTTVIEFEISLFFMRSPFCYATEVVIFHSPALNLP